MDITISAESAQVLVSLCQQVSLKDARSKLRVGTAQMELEQGLQAAAETPPAPEPGA